MSTSSLTTQEDAVIEFTKADFGVSDVDGGDVFKYLKIVDLPDSGTLFWTVKVRYYNSNVGQYFMQTISVDFSKDGLIALVEFTNLKGANVLLELYEALQPFHEGSPPPIPSGFQEIWEGPRFYFRPAANYFGQDADFLYQVGDSGRLYSATATFDLNVISVNDTPTTRNQAFSVAPDQASALPVVAFPFSDVDIDDWGKYLGDNTAATTNVDRLMHRSALLTFKGRSYRIKEIATRITQPAQQKAQSNRLAWRNLTGEKWGNLKWPSGIRSLDWFN